jgi:hypothetical protein
MLGFGSFLIYPDQLVGGSILYSGLGGAPFSPRAYLDISEVDLFVLQVVRFERTLEDSAGLGETEPVSHFE